MKNSHLRHEFLNVTLVTIPPPPKDDSVLIEKPPIQEIFNGKLLIKEFLSTTQDSSSYSLPRSSLHFQFLFDDSKEDIIFCESNLLDNLYKFQEFIFRSTNLSFAADTYDIIVEVLNMRIPLNLKVDHKDTRSFSDLLVRFKDEFELIEEMYYM
ncbi:hypothetical protein QEN19_002349 [Hanseniaspora menglaensis]